MSIAERSVARLLLVGAGLIGRRHAVAIRAARGAVLAAIADPDPNAQTFAADHGIPWYASIPDALEDGLFDAAIVATPNQHHEEGAIALIDAGLPVLIEKPLATSVAAGRRIVDAAKRRGVAVAVGHHRRYNPLVAAAKDTIGRGELGRIVAAHATVWLKKPADYFSAAWRRQPGAGPIPVNLIHDVDVLQHLCGPIIEVSAMASNAVRGHEVEDTAVAAVRFQSGALGTLTVSDTAAAPWSWELTAGENPVYTKTDQLCAMIAGTNGSLSIPQLTLWKHDGDGAWWDAMRATHHAPTDAGTEPSDPLVRQIEQFAAVARGEATPLCTGEDGLAALAAIEAIQVSAREGRAVRLNA